MLTKALNCALNDEAETFAGNKTFSGSISGGGGALFNVSSSSGSITSTSQYLAGTTGGTMSKFSTNNTTQTIFADYAWSHNIFLQDNAITEAASGDHRLVSNLSLQPINLTNGTATTTNAATLYIRGSTIGTATVTNNYALWVDSSYSRFDGRVLKTQGADVASVAGAIAVTDGNTFEVTGTNAVTLISNIGWQNGSEITLIFTSTASLTDGTANSGTDIGMELASNSNFSASADDVITLVLCEIGGTQRWREKSRSVN